ncbi:MAG: flippase [Xanthomonadales bacterium]|nr:flippase [Xanthomonadales bacterium]
MGHTLQIFSNIGWLVAGRVFQFLVSITVTVWLARYLGPQQFGTLSFALALVGILAVLPALGLHNIVVRDVVASPGQAAEILGSSMLVMAVAGIVTFGLLWLVVARILTDEMQTRVVVLTIGVSLVFSFTEVPRYWFESVVESKYTVSVTSLVLLITSLVTVYLIYREATLKAFAWVMLANSVAAGLLMVVVLRIRTGPLSRLRFNAQRARELLRDSWPLMLSGLAIMVYMKIDVLMLARMKGEHAAGIYGAATRISESWYFIPLFVVGSAFPAIIKARSSSPQQYRQRLQALYDALMLIAVSGAIVTTMVSDQIISVLFGEAYSSAGPVLSAHIWASVFVFLGVVSGRYLIAENRQVLNLQRNLAGALLNVALNYFVIPAYGPIGAAWTTVVSQAFAAFIFDVMQKETRQMFRMKLLSMNIPKSIGRLREHGLSLRQPST